MMRYVKLLIVVLSLAVCSLGRAEEAAIPEAADSDVEAAVVAEKPAREGVGPIEDVSGVLNKATALLSGNLEVQMELNQNKTPDKDYTYNAIGQRVPKATAAKAGGALHNE